MKKVLNVGVIGFGHIGSVIASSIANEKVRVIAIERDSKLIEKFLNNESPIEENGLQKLVNQKINNGTLKLEKDIKKLSRVDVIILTVGTPLSKKNEADLSHLRDTCLQVAPVVQNETLIIIKSTVTPGTTRNLAYPILSKNKNIHLAFSPERFAEGNAIEELNNLPIVIGGIDEKSTKKAYNFWKAVLNVKLIKVSNCETAEMVKLANNAWIDLNIALSNDLARLSDTLPYRLDILEIINAANSLKKGSSNVNILMPSSGVGGYCLTKDPLFLFEEGKKNGINMNTVIAARMTNDLMPSYSCHKIKEKLISQNKIVSQVSIIVMGLSFKTNSGDIRNTPVLPFIKSLKVEGLSNVSTYDPLIKDDDYSSLGLKKSLNVEKDIREADCIAVMNGHEKMFQVNSDNLIKLCRKGTIVFDGRKYYSQEAIYKMRSNGIEYLGIGR